MAIIAYPDSKMVLHPEILVVEDEAIVALELQERLNGLGYRAVRTVSRAEEALRCVEERRPDLVLMDIVLAGNMTGIEAAKLIGARFQVPVVYLTSHSDAATLEQIKKTEQHGFLTKPFRPEELQIAIELALARHGRELQRSAAERKTVEQDAEQHVQQFTYAAGHDLQEPLRTATCFIDLLARRAGPKLDAEERKLLEEAQSGLARMSTLLHDLLAYARAGVSQDASFPSTHAQHALDRAIANLQGAIAESGVEISGAVVGTVAANPTQLTQVFQNLLGNAIKYRKPTSPSKVQVGCEAKNGEVLFWVRDNGIGFDQTLAAGIFEPFRRLHGRREYGGTGIGLAICKKIVEAHGGRIWAESQPGLGSKFLFTFPCA